MLNRTRMVVVFVLSGVVAVVTSGCKSEEAAAPAKPESSTSTFPGYDPPSVSELVKQATDQGPPKEAAEPFAPRDVEVPEIVSAHTELLPRTESGEPLLVAGNGAALVVDTTLADPITAAAKCMHLVTACLQPPGIENRRDRDSCMMSAPVCDNNHPWDDSTACCPTSCKDVYQELRNKKYSQFDAWRLTRTGHCFPGLKEFMEAARSKAKEESK